MRFPSGGKTREHKPRVEVKATSATPPLPRVVIPCTGVGGFVIPRAARARLRGLPALRKGDALSRLALTRPRGVAQLIRTRLATRRYARPCGAAARASRRPGPQCAVLLYANTV